MDVETSWHIFINCLYAMETWRCSGLDLKLEEEIMVTDGMKDLVMRLVSDMDAKFAVHSCMLLWQLWKEKE